MLNLSLVRKEYGNFFYTCFQSITQVIFVCIGISYITPPSTQSANVCWIVALGVLIAGVGLWLKPDQFSRRLLLAETKSARSTLWTLMRLSILRTCGRRTCLTHSVLFFCPCKANFKCWREIVLLPWVLLAFPMLLMVVTSGIARMMLWMSVISKP